MRERGNILDMTSLGYLPSGIVSGSHNLIGLTPLCRREKHMNHLQSRDEVLDEELINLLL